MRRLVYGLMLTLLLTSMLTLAFNTQRVKAEGTIYIRADGTIDPPTAPIVSSDAVNYMLTGNITSDTNGILVQRNGIVIDGKGFTLQGSGEYSGIELDGMENVTIRNARITSFAIGIRLGLYCNHISLSGNNITANGLYGIFLDTSSNSSISGNKITTGNGYGIFLLGSSENSAIGNDITEIRYGIAVSSTLSNNRISRNKIAADNIGIWIVVSSNTCISGNVIVGNGYGIDFDGSSENSVIGNNITNNYAGICLNSSNDTVYHNNFINNTRQCYFWAMNYGNTLDDGYPSGGNYWSDYMGIDGNSDGLGDTPYIIDANNTDNHPLMHPWSPLPVHNINTGLGYDTIQEAINANETINGHAIFVDAGIYCENVVVNKTISLEGENRETTIINAGGLVGIEVVANDSRISRFTLCNARGYGLPFQGAILVEGFDNVISDNIFESNGQGIALWGGGSNTLTDNMIVNDFGSFGLVIGASSNNTFRNNAFIGDSLCNLKLMDLSFPWDVQDIDISNTVNGKPIIYLAEKQNLTISPDIYPHEIGILMLINSANMVVEGFDICYSENIDYPGHDYNVFLRSNVNLTIRNNTISHGAGIFLDSPNRDVFISNNTLHNNSAGIYAQRLSYTYITQNIFYHNYEGILIVSGSYNTIWENTFYNNTHEVLTCTGIVLGSQYTVIFSNNFTLNDEALRIYGSFNTVYGNNIANNSRGVVIGSGSVGDTIAHNNFINNTDQVRVQGEQLNIWDNGYPPGGNYWSDYNGTDLYNGPGQNGTGSDGISDIPYNIDENVTDRYPLMAPFNTFDAGTWNGTSYNVDIVSNSTVSGFQFNPSESALLRFNVTGDDGAKGFCRVTIPKILLWAEGEWAIIVGDKQITDYTVMQDVINTYLYFTYNLSTKTVQIQGTHVIPEFPSFLVLPLFMIATLLLLIIQKKRLNRRFFHKS